MCVVMGDASIVAWYPPMRIRAGESTDERALWMVICGAALAVCMLLADIDGPKRAVHWAVHGLRPGLMSGFAITSTNAFIAGATATPTHKHTVVFGLFALALSGVQIVFLNQAAREASAVDLQSVYVSCLIYSGTLVGLVTLDEAELARTTSSPGRLVWLALSLGLVVFGAYGVAREHHAAAAASSAV